MQPTSIVFFPGKGIYYLPTGEEIVPVHTAEEARAIFAGSPEAEEKAERLREFYIREGMCFEESRGLLAENASYDFGCITHSGTRSGAHTKPVDWEKVEADLSARGFMVHERLSVSEELNSLCPVFVVEGPGGVIAEGKGLDKEQSKRSALAEAVERLVSRGPNEKGQRYVSIDTYKHLYDGKEWDLGTLTGSRDAFAPDVLTEWLPATNLSRSESAFLPAEISYFEYIPQETRTRLFSLHHTMGLAAGSTREDATLSGIFEILERDAYWITMRCRLNLPDILLEEVKGLDARVLDIVQELSKKGLEIRVKDMSLDWGIPIAHAVIVDTKSGIPAFAHGTGASFSWATAIARAVCESVQMYEGLDAVMNGQWKWEDVVSVQGVLGSPELAWSDPLFRPHIEHLILESPEKKWNKEEHIQSVPDLLVHLEKLGHEVIVADLRSAYGLVVVRVFITNATQPDPRLERVSPRLEAWRIKAGLEKGFYTDPILT